MEMYGGRVVEPVGAFSTEESVDCKQPHPHGGVSAVFGVSTIIQNTNRNTKQKRYKYSGLQATAYPHGGVSFTVLGLRKIIQNTNTNKIKIQ